MNSKPVIVFKYGGNAMTDDALKESVLRGILTVRSRGYEVVIAHGGGPFIQEALAKAEIESIFIEGQRVTTEEAFEHIEMVLRGKVNSDLVHTINRLGGVAVGLSGRDGKTVIASKRKQTSQTGDPKERVDLGQVGSVRRVHPQLIQLLLRHGYIPVISCIGADEQGLGYNINGDNFAGHIAGALQADQFVLLTNVDGILRDRDDPGSLIAEIRMDQLEGLRKQGVIQGGMIPKTEACTTALAQGARSARILNGTRPEHIAALAEDTHGTLIRK